MRKTEKKNSFALSPTFTVLMSFVLVISIGSVLLMMPFSSSERSFTNPLTAVFTSVSATCVTGLTVVDTGLHWSRFGQIIILLMIQVGGIGLVTFASFVNFILHRKMELHTIKLAADSAGATFSDVKSMIKRIVGSVLIAEAIGMILLALYFVPRYGSPGLFLSLFLSVAAFCNAGFDVTSIYEVSGMSLEPYADNPYILTVLSVITIMGGLGFYVWTDLMEYRKTKKITFLTKLILISEAVLFILGGLYFTISEWSNPATFGDFPIWQKIINGFFYSVTTRSAGFFTVPEAGLTNDSTMLGIAWMFIGCASGSTGGGIKTTTFAIIAVTIWCVIRGKSDTLLFGRRVDKDLVYKAFSIMMLSALVVAVTTLVILNTNPPEKIGALDAAFEATSAFGTCGIPTGLEASLSVPSRLALCLTMLIGRVGPVTFAASLAIRQSKNNKSTTYPEAKIVVG